MEITPQLLQTITQQVMKVLEKYDIEANKKPKILQLGSVFSSEKIQNKYEVEKIQADSGFYDISQYKGILVTNLDHNQLVDLSNGRGSEIYTKVLCEALFLGTPIYIIEEGLFYQSYKETANPHFFKMFQGYVEKIQKFGIKVASIETIERELCKEKQICISQEKPEPKILLTAEAVRAYARGGENTLEVVAGTIITPLAKDVLREKKITIVEAKNAYL